MDKENKAAKKSPAPGVVKLRDQSNKNLISICYYYFYLYYERTEKPDLMSQFLGGRSFKPLDQLIEGDPSGSLHENEILAP